jgi:hypothetical protein
MIGRGWLWTVVAGVCALGSSPASLRAQNADNEREYAIKATYLYHFGSFIEWPKELAGGIGGKFKIGVLGKSAVVSPLQQIAGTKKVRGLAIQVQQFKSADDIKACHVLFVSDAAEDDKNPDPEARLKQALKQTKGKHILIVTEHEGLARKGSAMNFFIEENRVRFEINLEAARTEKLQISSNLLKLGKLVTKDDK